MTTLARVVFLALVAATFGAFGPTTWPGLIDTTRGRGAVVSSVISFGLTTERPCSSSVPRTR